MREDEIIPGAIFTVPVEQEVCAGVIIGTTTESVRTLVFGRISSLPGELKYPLQFPAMRNFKKKEICTYDFARELKLYRKSFCPSDAVTMVAVDITQYLLRGGTLENYGWWHAPVSKEYFLLLWTMLHGHFPGCVKKPPREIRDGNVVFQVYYTSFGKPYIITMFADEGGENEQSEEGC